MVHSHAHGPAQSRPSAPKGADGFASKYGKHKNSRAAVKEFSYSPFDGFRFSSVRGPKIVTDPQDCADPHAQSPILLELGRLVRTMFHQIRQYFDMLFGHFGYGTQSEALF